MANFVNRAKYYARSLRKAPFVEYYSCPNCGGRAATVTDRKYLITSLARCHGCEMLYRRPVTTQAEAERFYEADYTTDKTGTPPDPDNPRYRDPAYLRSVKDQSDYARVLPALGLPEGARVFDYGCSWGYGSGQLMAAGFRLGGYEASPSNRVFARTVIGVEVTDDYAAFARDPAQAGAWDVWFSSHVLEHLTSVETLLDGALRLVRPGGFLVLFVPNGSEAFMHANRPRWHRLWGEVHPLFLSDRFFARKFAGLPLLLGASPLADDALRQFGAGGDPGPQPLVGKELACIVRRPG